MTAANKKPGGLAPVERNAYSILFSPRDVHAALARLDGRVCPPDRIEFARVRASEARNGHPRVSKEKVRPQLDVIDLDFSAVNL